jgi:hypothetical protein
MRLSIALLAAAACALVTAACGTTRRQVGAPQHTTSAAVVGADPKTTPTQDDFQGGYDTDDEPERDYGHKASAADAKAIGALVTRYYAAGARGDGAAACALTARTFASTVPADYGQELGSAIPPGAETYLRGAKTCAAVLSLLFEHARSQITAPVAVIGVRLKGSYGYALVGSMTLPTSLIEVEREDGVWRVDGLMGRPLP